MWKKILTAIVAQNAQLAEDLINTIEPNELNRQDDSGKTLLMIAINANQREACQSLVELMYTANFNVRQIFSCTELDWVAPRSMTEVCKLLISKMSIEAINAIDNGGNTALGGAVYKRMTEIYELLIPKMSTDTINTANNYNNTALSFAASNGDEEICELLISKMSTEAINTIDREGRTALTWSAYEGMEKICELLIPLVNNEGINTANFQKHTLLAHAVKHKMNNASIHFIFLANQKTLNSSITDNYTTPLAEAIKNNMIKVSKALIPLMSVEAIKTSRIIYDEYFHSKTLLEYTEQHSKIILYKMLFAKVHSSYQSAFGKVGETELSNIESIKKSLFSLADFFIKSFTNSDSEKSTQVEIKFEDFNKFKFYQQINRDLLKSCIDYSGANGASLLKKVDTYIAIKYFTIAGISPSINLPEDPANHIFSYLEFPSLLAINTYEANAVGITSESSSDVSLGG